MQEPNQLFPIFLRTDRLTILIVGGGNVAEEKLHFLLKSSPNSRIILVAPYISEKIISYSNDYDITFINREYKNEDLKGIDLVIAATNNKEINSYIWTNSKLKGVLINVADTPDLCDFYLGGIVTKGDFKIAISTNGKSPTLAKRLRQLLEKNLPDEINQLAEHLNKVRNIFGDSFETKVKELNRITKNLINN
ncbi:precorrin-2 dehydrogenase/sirohydrochlorin ferrochelatase family protein [Membranihabitans maritimus]|uniref:precorrin-2 dehydrogenase/sirohydrochlorin ferrochelatase family protein n=1 Tax=Membranihabitans maritimus TaxID=2904244 RepID=UPI001F20A63D|nr:bifunctional precorrin-2 dehydrogenase/sirohydrochlorin ferrochelatase [Membranihabitans maritimus]